LEGGIILNPILQYFFIYSAKKSITICYIIILFGSVGNLFNLYKETLPNGVPIIYYDLIIITLPLMLSGAIYGVSINLMLPDLFIGIILSIILCYSFYMTFKKFKSQRKLEKDQNLIKLVKKPEIY